MLLLEQDTIRKEQVDESTITQLEFEAGNDKKYEVEDIRNKMVFAKKFKANHLPELYYWVIWKNYSEKKNI